MRTLQRETEKIQVSKKRESSEKKYFSYTSLIAAFIHCSSE
jgi:hypothetical protein